MNSFNCPFCDQYLEAPPEAMSRRIQCGTCERKFTLEEKHLAPVKKGAEVPENKKNSSRKENVLKSKKNKTSKSPLTLIFAILFSIGGFLLYSNLSKDKQNLQSTDLAPSQNPENTPPQIAVVAEKDQQVSGLAPIKKKFPVIHQFKKMDIVEWRKTYPNVHAGWMPSKLEKGTELASVKNEALSWGHHFGPLGIRVRSHIPQHQNREAFAAMVPDCLRTKEGELGLSAIEIVSIASGSPADGYLKKGDLILAIEEEYIKPGNYYRPDWSFVTKDRRDVQLQVGELIDKAQARGDIRLKVLRWAQNEKNLFNSEILDKNNKMVNTGFLPVKAGQKLKLIIDTNGKNKYDQACWVKPQLQGPKGSLDLAKTAPFSASTGWGKIIRGKDFNGAKMPDSSITVHGFSEMVFIVPEGFERFSSEIRCLNNGGSFKVRVQVEEARMALPIEKKLLWSGKGGSKKLGVQEFEASVTNGQLILNVDQFNGNIHGDGAVWVDLELTGSYGTKNLIEMPWKSANNGYGRMKKYLNGETLKINEQETSNAIYVHANANIIYDLPEGTTGVKGKFTGMSHGQVQPRVYLLPESLPLTGVHASKLVDLRFPIGKTGSFKKGFPEGCPKSELTIKRQAAWLAAQQLENGSWPRWAGYTHSLWDTAHAGLALMSTGDSSYDSAIRKAAHFCSFKAPSSWTVPRSMILIFLCEYYLRYKDKAVLASIQNNYSQLESCIKTDLISGHKVLGFGYGIAGQYIATGHMMLGMAMAAKVPINIDKKFVDEIVTHAARVAVNGTFPYGRGRRMKRSDKRNYTGGNSMLGPAVLAAYVYGGHESFLQDTAERFRASIGEGDNSHATSSLAFIWSTTAMAVLDKKLYYDHLEHFKYKLTIDDCWDGGYLKSAFPLDYQGGENVTGLWIRSAGTLMALCANRKNLAITGSPQFRPTSYKKGVPATEWETFIRQYYLRNWLISKELLGSASPTGLNEAIKQLAALPADETLIDQTKKLVLAKAPEFIQQIQNQSITDKQLKAYAIELLCGIDFQITLSAEGDQQKIELLTLLPFNELNWNEDGDDKRSFFEQTPFQAEVKIESGMTKAVSFKIDSLEKINTDRGNLKLTKKTVCSQKDGVFSGNAQVTFKLGNHKVNYTRKLYFNKPFIDSRVGNPVNFRRFKLPLRMAPRAIYQSLPLQIGGYNFDAMYPAEKMMYPSYKGQRSSGMPWVFHEGDDVIVDFVSSTPICSLVLDLDFQSRMKYEKPQKVEIIKGEMTGNTQSLQDGIQTTKVQFTPVDNQVLLEYTFSEEVPLNGMDIVRSSSGLVRIWALVKDRWVPLVWDNYSSRGNFHPEFHRVKAKKWRVELNNNRKMNVNDLLFYNNLKRRALPRPVQLDDNSTYSLELIKKGS